MRFWNVWSLDTQMRWLRSRWTPDLNELGVPTPENVVGLNRLRMMQDHIGASYHINIERYMRRDGGLQIYSSIPFTGHVNFNSDVILSSLFANISTDNMFAPIYDNSPIFVIVMKGTKIGFYVYRNRYAFNSEGILNWWGFVPLNYMIPRDKFISFNNNYDGNTPFLNMMYQRYINSIDFTTDFDRLTRMGAEGSNEIPYPHILDYANLSHREEIRKMFRFASNISTNAFF